MVPFKGGAGAEPGQGHTVSLPTASAPWRRQTLRDGRGLLPMNRQGMPRQHCAARTNLPTSKALPNLPNLHAAFLWHVGGL